MTAPGKAGSVHIRGIRELADPELTAQTFRRSYRLSIACMAWLAFAMWSSAAFVIVGFGAPQIWLFLLPMCAAVFVDTAAAAQDQLRVIEQAADQPQQPQTQE